jgi:hypothetical protein
VRDDRRQPRSETLELACVGSLEPQPRFLNSVVCFAERAEDPVGDRAQPWAFALELACQLKFAHVRHILFV